MATAKTAVEPAAVPAWMNTLRTGKQQVPPRICLYGAHGVGKSTLASQFPAPIFISTEDGLASLDVTSFPRATVIGDVVENIKTLLKEEHNFKTLVVDTLDWLIEPLIVNSVNSQYDEKAQAYGKGSVYVAEEFREILQGLDALRMKKGMNIVLIAHAAIVKFEDPRSDPYDRYTPKLPKVCNALMQEWVDVLAFVAFKVIIKKSDAKGFDTARTRGVSTGERLLHFIENPAYMAKNRFNCPEEVEMSVANLAKLIPLAS
jgi:GTPase SAR1 family protein